MKLDNGIYSIENFHSLINEKLCGNLIFWLETNTLLGNNLNYTLLALEIFNKCLNFSDGKFIQLLRESKVTELINNISVQDPSFRNFCDDIIKIIVNNTNFNNNSNYNDSYTQHVTIENKISEGNNSFNTGNNFNYFNNQISFRDAEQKKQTISYNENSFATTNRHTQINLPNKPGQISFLNLSPSFPQLNVSKMDEQVLFDININLKFGDSLQISNNLNILYSSILNDYPIEYLLQNSDMMKTILVLIEKTNFYEYGIILYKILDKIYILLEKKIQQFQESHIKTNFGISKKKGAQMTTNELSGFSYPPLLTDNKKIQELKKISRISYVSSNSGNSISITDFLVLSMEALLLSMNETEKFPFSMNLIQKNFQLLKKVIFSSDSSNDEWIEILEHILVKCHSIIEHFKDQKIKFDPLCEFFIKFLISFSEDALFEFLSQKESIMNIIKDVVFILQEYNNPLVINFFEKIKKLIEKLNNLELNSTQLTNNLSSMIEDYNIAEIVRKSILMTSGKINTDLEGCFYIIENFDNILVALKYILEVGGPSNSQENNNEINSLYEIPLLKILCECIKFNIDTESIIKNLQKLLSFSNMISFNKSASGLKFKILFFKSFLENLEELIGLIRLEPKIILYLFNELSNENLSSDLENLILEIFNKIYENICFNNQEHADNSFYEIFSMFPYYTKNIKINSLHNKIDSKYLQIKNCDKNLIFIKYLRLLFSKDEMLRLNSLNYLQLFTIEEKMTSIISKKLKIIQFLDFKNHSSSDSSSLYEKLKKSDTILAINSAFKEFPTLINNISENSNLDLEFYPLLNIIYSNKLEYNLKVSAIEQIIFLINKKEFKNIFINDLLDHTIRELLNVCNLFKNEENLKNLGSDVINYLTSLMKLLVLIIYFHRSEDKVKQVFNILEFEIGLNLIQNILKLMFLTNIKNKHMLTVYSMIFLYYASYSDENFPLIIKQNLNNEMHDGKSFVVLKLFQKFSYINLLPGVVTSTFMPENNISYWMKINYTKHVIEYLHFKNEKTKKNMKNIFDISEIKNEINLNITNYLQNGSHEEPNYLETYFSFIKFFSYLIKEGNSKNNLYENNSNEIIIIFSFFKKLIPLKNEDKNIISDFLNILGVYTKTNLGSYSQVITKPAVKILNDMILNYITFIANNKEFLDGLEKPWGENQVFLYSLLIFLNENELLFKDKEHSFILKNKEIVNKFISVFSNLIIFDEKFYAIRFVLVKFKIIYFDFVFNKNNENISTLFINSINYIDFYISKFESSDSFNNNNFIQNCLVLLNKVREANIPSVNEHLIKKSFSVVKYLSSVLHDTHLLALRLLTNFISIEFLQKHPLLITSIFDSLLNEDLPYILKINSLNFLNLSLEFLLQSKEFDSHSDFFNEIVSLNSKLFEESVLSILLTLINKNLNTNSLFCALIFKLISNIIIVNSSQIGEENLTDYMGKNFYMNLNFYETFNEIIIKEKDNLKSEYNYKNTKSTSNLKARYTDIEFYQKIYLQEKIESFLNINESFNLVLKSFTKIEFKVLLEKYKNIFSDIFINLFALGVEIRRLFKFMKAEFNNAKLQTRHRSAILLKTMKEYVTKYFSFLNFTYTFRPEVINENLIVLKNIEFSQAQDFFNLIYDFLKFEENQDSEKDEISSLSSIRLMFAKNLPYLIETLQFLNKDNNSLSQALTPLLSLKNESDMLLELMTAFKSIYDIKLDIYGYEEKVKCIFEINQKNLSSKNTFMNSITSLLLDSQNCKKIFIKSKFINTFIDYTRQLTEFLYENNLNTSTSTNKELNTSKKSSTSFNKKKESQIQREKNNFLLDYALNEYKNLLILFQNLVYNFEDCEEKKQLFIKNEYENISANTSKSLNTTKNSKLSSTTNQVELEKPQKFVILLYDIFYETIRYPELFSEYLKLLINTVSKNDLGKKSFILPIASETKETFLSLILDYFNKNFNVFQNNPHFELFVKFLRSLFQNKFIVLYLFKTKFVDNLIKDLESLINNKKFLQSLSNQNSSKFLENILNIFVSLSFDYEISKKVATKEFVENLTNLIVRVKNENIIYNTLFLFRNFSFIPTNKLHFMVNENLLGTIFALLTGEFSIKIKFMLSNLLWVLLFNNQTVSLKFF
jgi:hypothetical protein